MGASSRKPFHLAVRPTESSADRARELRHIQSPPEGVLWSRLRRKQLGGFRFRRQHPVGPYIADFYCHEAALVVEIDSRHHAGADAARHDITRDQWMRERRIEVLRLDASDVATDIQAVLRRIHHAASSRTRR